MNAAKFCPSSVKSSFKLKLVGILSAINLVIFCITGFLSYRIHLYLYDQEISKQFAKTNEQALNEISFRIQDLYRITNFISYNRYVEESVTQKAAVASPYDRYIVEERLNDQLGPQRSDVPEMLGIALFDLEGNGFQLGNQVNTLRLLGADVFAKLKAELNETHGEFVWEKIQLNEGSNGGTARDMLVAARWMKDPQLQNYGMIVLLLNDSLFGRYLHVITQGETGKVFLHDNAGKLLYTDANDPKTFDVPFLASDQAVLSIGQTPYLFVKSVSSPYSLSLVSCVSLEDLNSKSQVILQVALISAIASILLAGIFILLAGQRLLRPLQTLVEGMRKIREGDFEARIDIQTHDELAYLANSFNAMAENVNSLIREVYLRQLGEREAELQAIQAQLNPHFLYNTLDMFYWRFYLLQDEESARLIVALSQMLRYALEPAHSFSTVREEVELLRHYLSIQTARNKNVPQISIQVDKTVLHCPMIRFLLQPLVENVFVHAFKKKQDEQRLELKIYRQWNEKLLQDALYLEIADNGCGMDAETVNRVLGQPVHTQEGGGRACLGIRSVVRRIHLLCGEPYHVDICSMPGQGTKIRLMLPCNLAESGGGEYAWKAVTSG